MLEKSANAVQTASSRPPVKAGQTKSISERIERMYDAISRRAYELFERDGRVDGHDVGHWMEAEKEFLLPVQIGMEEADREFVVRAEVPGFTASELEVNVEPRRVTISGKRESKQETKKGEALRTEESSNEIFRAIELPSEANATKVSAILKDGVLEIKIPKAETKKSVPANTQAA
jgi:HSP20 family molecular chaperone IbpA